MWRRWPPWWLNSIGFLHVTSPPTPGPTTNQPPIQQNISANIRRMKTFQVTILCPCRLPCWLCSVETILNSKWQWKWGGTCGARCSAERTLTCHVFCGAILTNKTWLADKDHLGQNDRQLKLYTLIIFVGPSHLFLMHFKVLKNFWCTY